MPANSRKAKGADRLRCFHDNIPAAPYAKTWTRAGQLGRNACAYLRRPMSGISGVNFAVAKLRHAVLVETGNSRKPPPPCRTYIAIRRHCRKVVETFSDGSSAVFHPAALYYQPSRLFLISRRASPAKDSPREVHLVLLDGGRSQTTPTNSCANLQCIAAALYEPLPVYSLNFVPPSQFVVCPCIPSQAQAATRVCLRWLGPGRGVFATTAELCVAVAARPPGAASGLPLGLAARLRVFTRAASWVGRFTARH